METVVELTYVGSHDEVEVRVPDWPVLPVVAHGASYAFPAAIAELLLEQPDNWRKAPKKKAGKPAHDEAGPAGEEQ